MKYRLVNEAQAFKNWSSVITEATGVKDPKKLKWMSTMLQIGENVDTDFNLLKESYGQIGPESMTGMGAVKFPSDPGSGVGASQGAFFNPAYKAGSGDVPSPKLAIAMNVAAYTIGLELLPSIPMEFPSSMFSYVDHVYAGGQLDNAADAPTYIELTGGIIGTAAYAPYPTVGATFVVFGESAGGAAVAGPAFEVAFVQKHRINGGLIVKVISTGSVAAAAAGAPLVYTANSSSAVADLFTLAGVSIYRGTVNGANVGTGKALSTAGQVVKASLVSALDSHIPEFSNNAAPLNVDATVTGTYRMTREQAENGTQQTINLRFFSTSVEAGQIEVIATLTKTQLKDLSVYGVDGLAQIYRAAQNELTQTINKDVLRNIFRLGVTSAVSLQQAQGFNINLFINNAAGGSRNLSAFGLAEFKDILGVDRSGEFTAIPNAETNSAAENLSTRQRRLASRILAAANMISTVGRHGKGDFAVVNSHIASALQDVKMFAPAGFENNISVDTKNLYMIGTIQGGVDVYCDPNMTWDDTRIAVGRRGTDQDPGLKMFIYQLAESVEVISETSMAPKVSVTSRYALLPAGFYPEAQYLTFGVDSELGWI